MLNFFSWENFPCFRNVLSLSTNQNKITPVVTLNGILLKLTEYHRYSMHIESTYLTWVWKVGSDPILAPPQSFLDLCPSASSSSPQDPGWVRPPGWAGTGHWANGTLLNPLLEGCAPNHSLLWQWHMLLCCARIWGQIVDGGLKGVMGSLGDVKYWIVGLDPCGMLFDSPLYPLTTF